MNLLLVCSILATAAAATAQGGLLGSFTVRGMNTPAGLEHDLAGNLLYATQLDGIGTMDASTGAILSSSGPLTNTGRAGELATDGTRIYVSDWPGSDVDVYDTSYNYLSSFSVAAQMWDPGGIAYRAANGHLYVMNGRATCHEYDTAGTFVTSYPVLGSGGRGMAWDSATDTFWIYDRDTDTIRNFDPSFNQLASFPGTVAAGFGKGVALAFINRTAYLTETPFGNVLSQIVLFDTTGNAGYTVSYGRGCPNASTFYESFSPGFDLANSSILLQPNNHGGWTVQRSSGTIDTSFSHNLQLGDTTQTRRSLGFILQLPRGSYSSISIGSDGYCGWGVVTADPTESVSEFVTRTMICPFWDDLNPAAGGGVYFDQRPSYAMITWDRVPEAPNKGANTAQVKIFPNGTIEILWGACTLQDCLVGVSDSSGVDPGATDLSAALPLVTSRNGTPITLTPSARPALGTTIDMTTRFIPGNATAGGLLGGLSHTRLRLDSLGMVDCSLHTSAEVVHGGFAPPNGTVQVVIPNLAPLHGLSLYWQSFVISPNANAVGVLTSQGIETRLGF